jgi:hypothetical protein
VDPPQTAPDDLSRRRRTFLYGIVLSNVVVWVVWAIGDRGGGVPWPAWVTLASAAVVASRLGGRRFAPAPGTGRQRNRNRNRNRSRRG